MQDTPVVKLCKQHETLLSGTPPEKLEVLKELLAISNDCRTCAEALAASALEDPTAREKNKPWREFQKITGEPIFNALVEIVRHDPPSEVRELTGDIMAQLWHPCAVSRLLEDFEQHMDTLAEKSPLRIFRNLGGIGTEAATRALMWMWGSKWDADVLNALGMCNCAIMQDFIVRQATEHSNPHVRSMCLAHLTAPVTVQKEDLLLARLKSGTPNEQFVAVMKIQEFGVVRAAAELVAIRTKNGAGVLAGLINETLSVLRCGNVGRLQRR